VRTAPNWDAYPPRWLRVSIVANTLREMTFTADASALEKEWADEFGAPRNNLDFAGDAATMAAAILKGPYDPVADSSGRAGLDDVMSFRKDANGDPMDISVAEGIRGRGGVSHGTAIEFVAASRIVFETAPAEYDARRYGDAICAYIDRYSDKGTRGTPPQDLEAVAATDAALAAAEGR